MAIIVTAVVIMRAFSPEPESVVSEYLDATITGENGYEYFDAWDHGAEQIFGKVVRGYEVKNVIGDVVSVDITFASTAGSDIHQTLRFTVTRGKIRVI